MNFTGDWNWPISDPKITQEYGMSYWARLGWYNGGPHTGIDMTSTNSIIKAPKKGTLYKGSASCRGVGMNFVAIDHGDGLISWYWHVQ
jgi:murein DD-endopeptidase MepM/ murein hydrolase activator NlpD